MIQIPTIPNSLEGFSSVQSLVGLAAAATTIVLLCKWHQASHPSKGGVPLPPGPPACWFWQNVIPAANIAKVVADCVTQFGPVFSLRQGSEVIVAIGRMYAAVEIMEKEGGSLVDRPHLIAAGDLVSGGLRIILTPAGERFRLLRRAVHTQLQPKAAEAYQEIQTNSAKDVIIDILNDSKHHIEHAQRYATSIVLRITYGESTPTSRDDPEVVRVYEALTHFQENLVPGRYLVERIPLLRYVPGYGKQLKEYHRSELQLFRDQLGRVRDEMAKDEAGPSFARTLLEGTKEHQLSFDEMAYAAGTMSGAGPDTVAIVITTMIMAAACHPEAQARVQKELDLVVGADRVPTFEDSSALPQLHAFILEALRWRPVISTGTILLFFISYLLGIPHRATKDIIWRGMCIPAGATVYGCHWAISRDPVAFRDPDKFNPQRWLNEEGQLHSDMRFCTFGFGRRVCPAQHVVTRSFYITLALLLWSFRIVERPDAPIDMDAFKDGILWRPLPFEVVFAPRMDEGKLREIMGERA
ncbi:hypothetical protein HYDPIDRAFT_88479 [Hydnomerulius pinastri MD-312]|nr:hypothetical protein HYDPIDRAFT_88479 [Hydnomerulius pinastri MD-312]